MDHTTDEWRKAWLYEHHYDHRGTIPQTEGIRTPRWKYTRYLGTDPLFEELFNLKRDPHEQHNLADKPEHASILKEMRGKWAELAKAAE